MHAYFTRHLLAWNQTDNDRQMPWKGEKNPYKIWLSEIILQQTRVDQGLAYYNRFVQAFPTIKLLANASDTAVFKLWEGLGYYSRCKNLLITARVISKDLKGKFPANYEELLALKGVGPYTAAAIASFAYNLPYAVVDGNVFRVLARFFGMYDAIDSAAGKKLFTALANSLLDKKKPGEYNQALMDFGAVICKPKLPQCGICPLQNKCIARQQGTIALLPVKEKSIVKKTRWFYYVVAGYGDGVYVKKRGAGDIWENLYEFILIETDAAVDIENIIKQSALKKITGSNKMAPPFVSPAYRQLLTHQVIHGQFIQINLSRPLASKDYICTRQEALKGLPFPKLISSFLKDKNVSLNLFQQHL